MSPRPRFDTDNDWVVRIYSHLLAQAEEYMLISKIIEPTGMDQKPSVAEKYHFRKINHYVQTINDKKNQDQLKKATDDISTKLLTDTTNQIIQLKQTILEYRKKRIEDHINWWRENNNSKLSSLNDDALIKYFVLEEMLKYAKETLILEEKKVIVCGCIDPRERRLPGELTKNASNEEIAYFTELKRALLTCYVSIQIDQIGKDTEKMIKTWYEDLGLPCKLDGKIEITYGLHDDAKSFVYEYYRRIFHSMAKVDKLLEQLSQDPHYSSPDDVEMIELVKHSKQLVEQYRATQKVTPVTTAPIPTPTQPQSSTPTPISVLHKMAKPKSNTALYVAGGIILTLAVALAMTFLWPIIPVALIGGALVGGIFKVLGLLGVSVGVNSTIATVTGTATVGIGGVTGGGTTGYICKKLTHGCVGQLKQPKEPVIKLPPTVVVETVSVSVLDHSAENTTSPSQSRPPSRRGSGTIS